MKGRVGTATFISVIKDPRKKYKARSNMWCTRCKKTIWRGTWARPVGTLVAHLDCRYPGTPTGEVKTPR